MTHTPDLPVWVNLIDRWMPRFLRPLWERLIRSHIGYRLFHGTSWYLIGVMVGRTLSIPAGIIVARMFGKALYGEYGIVQSTIGMFGLFAAFGLGLTAIRHVAQHRRSDPERAGRILALSELTSFTTGGLGALVLLIGAPWLAVHSLAAPQVAGPLRAGALLLWLTAINGAQDGALTGFEAFRAMALRNIIAGLASLPFVAGGAWLGGVTGAVLGLSASMGLKVALNHFVIRNECRRHRIRVMWRTARHELSVLVKFSLPALLANLISTPVTWICSAMLVRQPGGMAQMGLYSAASNWRGAMLYLPAALSSVILPVLSNLHSERDARRYGKLLWAGVVTNGGLMLCVWLGLIVFAQPLMGLYGTAFREGRQVLIVLGLSAVLRAITSVIAQSIVSAGRMWIIVWFNSMRSVVMISGSYWLVPRHGAAGLAWALVLSYVAHTVWQGLYLVRIQNQLKQAHELHPMKTLESAA